ncbi:MAG TPA: TetR family transcriptional regulator [Nocardiopsis listeri]|uniref:TetR/AcrR family transcriptional regulator n=1 Tax=Nocardiopsis listeri TaxID=53440 RepID=UPI001D9BDC16|nr:TetR family transcriptional regulator [Nocardiopsis listeri]HJE60033.1 TetR family transcriptional regulator [Nocardiopsis listeri]
MSGSVTRSGRVAATRERILVAAERLFAEHGPSGVSNRRIGQAADQGNNTAVTYHFGSKAGLVLAIARRHTEPIEEIRLHMVSSVEGSTEARDWVACMVEPFARHLADLGTPSWYARFTAQVMGDLSLRRIVSREALGRPSLVRAGEALHACLPDLPDQTRAERQDMARQLMIHTLAERERALSEGVDTPQGSWRRAAVGLTDALTGLWLAPVTEVCEPAEQKPARSARS